MTKNVGNKRPCGGIELMLDVCLVSILNILTGESKKFIVQLQVQDLELDLWRWNTLSLFRLFNLSLFFDEGNLKNDILNSPKSLHIGSMFPYKLLYCNSYPRPCHTTRPITKAQWCSLFVGLGRLSFQSIFCLLCKQN